MDPTMDNTKHILNYLMPIIDQVNPDLHDFMQRYICVYIYVCTYTHTPLQLSPSLCLFFTSLAQLHHHLRLISVKFFRVVLSSYQPSG